MMMMMMNLIATEIIYCEYYSKSNVLICCSKKMGVVVVEFQCLFNSDRFY